VDFIVGDFEDFIVGDLDESLDPLASEGDLVFLLILGPLVDLRSLATVVAQIRAKRRKRVLREFILLILQTTIKF
jgi:hypothetical protein